MVGDKIEDFEITGGDGIFGLIESEEQNQEESQEENQEETTDSTEEQETTEEESTEEESSTEEETTEEEETSTEESEEETETQETTSETEGGETSESTDDDQTQETVDIEAELTSRVNATFGNQFNSLGDVQKALNERAVLKDDYIKKVVEVYNKTGDLSPFLQATQVKLDDMSSIEVLRHKFERDHKGMPRDAMENKFFREVVQKFKQDPQEEDDENAYTEQEVKYGKAEMDFEANKVREALKEEQAEFLKPDKVEEKEEPTQEQIKQREEQAERTRNVVKKSISDLIPKGVLTVEVDKNKVNFDGVDIERLTELALAPNAQAALFVKDGKVDWTKLIKTMYYAENMEKFEKILVSSAKSQNKKEIVHELNNSTTQRQEAEKVESDFSAEEFDPRNPAHKQAFAEEFEIVKK